MIDTYKATLRIPTEQYAYVEIHVEGTADYIAEANREFTDLFKVKEGVPRSVFNAFLDKQLEGYDGNSVDTYEAMSERQKLVVQEVKKAIKRIDSKTTRDGPGRGEGGDYSGMY